MSRGAREQRPAALSAVAASAIAVPRWQSRSCLAACPTVNASEYIPRRQVTHCSPHVEAPSTLSPAGLGLRGATGMWVPTRQPIEINAGSTDRMRSGEWEKENDERSRWSAL